MLSCVCILVYQTVPSMHNVSSTSPPEHVGTIYSPENIQQYESPKRVSVSQEQRGRCLVLQRKRLGGWHFTCSPPIWLCVKSHGNKACLGRKLFYNWGWRDDLAIKGQRLEEPGIGSQHSHGS